LVPVIAWSLAEELELDVVRVPDACEASSLTSAVRAERATMPIGRCAGV
jgi:hypothetical protein